MTPVVSFAILTSLARAGLAGPTSPPGPAVLQFVSSSRFKFAGMTFWPRGQTSAWFSQQVPVDHGSVSGRGSRRRVVFDGRAGL